MPFCRVLDLPALLEKKTHFLFGPRLSGKTTLIKQQLPPAYQVFDLLDSDVRLRLLERPALLREMIAPKTPAVVIDEIQKIPALLDEIHALIENRRLRFLLTGSSARNLKRTGTNLLGGRARTARLFPLVAREIPGFDLQRCLLFGALPSIYLSDEPYAELRDYVDLYLKEEIQEEARLRNLPAFVRFLKSAALQNAQLVNYAAVASDAMVPESTVRSHYQILQDTLLGSLVEPWRASRKRKAIQTSKFYFFDTGVCHALLEMKSLERNSSSYGAAFEHWLYMEISACLSYRRVDEPLRFWRSVNGQEVDFLIGDTLAVEVKATQRTTPRDLAGLRALAEERAVKNLVLVSQDPLRQRRDEIDCMPWQDFLDALWQGHWL